MGDTRLVLGGARIVVDRETGELDEWPHLDHLDQVQRMCSADGSVMTVHPVPDAQSALALFGSRVSTAR